MIGIFDSGSGGLSVASVLRKSAPSVDVLYFGDIANAPYGEKDLTSLSQLTEQGIHILKEHGAEKLLSACNSISSAVLAGVARDMPFVEMSLPTAKHLRKFSGERFLLLATPATIESHLYTKAIDGYVDLDPLGIPGLAGAIEFGDMSLAQDCVRRALSSRKGERYDGIILGCTHYPLIRDLITEISFSYFGNINIIDPAIPVAEEAVRRFGAEGAGTTTFLISQDSQNFRERVRDMFGVDNASIEVVPLSHF